MGGNQPSRLASSVRAQDTQVSTQSNPLTLKYALKCSIHMLILHLYDIWQIHIRGEIVERKHFWAKTMHPQAHTKCRQN